MSTTITQAAGAYSSSRGIERATCVQICMMHTSDSNNNTNNTNHINNKKIYNHDKFIVSVCSIGSALMQYSLKFYISGICYILPVASCICLCASHTCLYTCLYI